MSTNGITLRTNRVKIGQIFHKEKRGGGEGEGKRRGGTPSLTFSQLIPTAFILKKKIQLSLIVTFLRPEVTKGKLLTCLV